MIRVTQRLNRLLYKQHVDYVEYVLLLLILVFGAVATGQALTHQIGKEFNQITNGF
jgi:Flp pilus assembly pilin Flp